MSRYKIGYVVYLAESLKWKAGTKLSIPFAQKSVSGVRSLSEGNEVVTLRSSCKVKPVLNESSRAQNIFLLKPGFDFIKVYYNN